MKLTTLSEARNVSTVFFHGTPYSIALRVLRTGLFPADHFNLNGIGNQISEHLWMAPVISIAKGYTHSPYPSICELVITTNTMRKMGKLGWGHTDGVLIIPKFLATKSSGFPEDEDYIRSVTTAFVNDNGRLCLKYLYGTPESVEPYAELASMAGYADWEPDHVFRNIRVKNPHHSAPDSTAAASGKQFSIGCNIVRRTLSTLTATDKGADLIINHIKKCHSCTHGLHKIPPTDKRFNHELIELIKSKLS